MSDAAVLVLQRRDHVAWLVMNRPASANALDAALQGALVQALRRAAQDASVRAVVLTGQGERVFSAGADMKEFSDLPVAAGRTRRRDLLRETLLALVDFGKPLIAGVNGKAIGAGCMLALLADEVHLADHAGFALPEMSLGIATPVGASIAAARGGRRAAHLLAQSGKPMAAQAAVAIGLADGACPRDQLGDVSQSRATALGALPGRVYGQNKRWINAALRAEILRALDESARLQTETDDEEQSGAS